MPQRGGLIFSASLHILVVLAAVLGLPQLFDRKLPEETPIVVQLVNIAPETRATKLTKTEPKPDKPEEVAQAEPPKPEPPKPEPPKPPPPVPPESAPKPPDPKPESPKPEPPPPPPPEAKPEPAKVEPPAPKPPPPKPEAPKQKKDDAELDSLLKNLAKQAPTRTADQPAKQTAAAEPAKASSQPVAPLGPQLTTSELDFVRQQIEACWNVPAGARDAKGLTPEFRVYMNPDGTIRSATQLNAERNRDPFFQAAAESALRALRNPRCQPLKLPPQKYNQWQTFTITFDPRDIS